jgi:hypothetical protein
MKTVFENIMKNQQDNSRGIRKERSICLVGTAEPNSIIIRFGFRILISDEGLDEFCALRKMRGK